jgi:uncharacterized protein YutE (UPF0331/DUF86 family)
MTYLVERLADLRRHLDHLLQLRDRVPDAGALARDQSLHNDVLFSLFMVCQLVVDVSGEIATRHGMTFADYTTAVRSAGHALKLESTIVTELERLPGFRNILVHEYVGLDLARAVAALQRLQPIETFLTAVAAEERRGV